MKYIDQFILNGNQLSFRQVEAEIGRYGGLLFDFLAVKNAINNSDYNTVGDITESNETEIISLALNNKQIRQYLPKQNSTENSCKEYWKNKLNLDIEPYYKHASLATKESRLRLL